MCLEPNWSETSLNNMTGWYKLFEWFQLFISSTVSPSCHQLLHYLKVSYTSIKQVFLILSFESV